jgi:hypothetical protein
MGVAEQRRRQWARHRGRGCCWLGRLGVGIACVGLIAACSPQPTEPAGSVGVPRPGGGQPGGTPPPPQPSLLLGTWRSVTTVFLPNTIQTTTWRFAAEGLCQETFLTITDGAQLTTDRACTYEADATNVTVTYAGPTGPVTFTMRYSFPTPNVLRLDADEFDRVA